MVQGELSSIGMQRAALDAALTRDVQGAVRATASGDLLGIGVDVQEIASFEQLALEEHRAFYERVFTANEIDYCRACATPAEHFAARFAAKEAVVKACGNAITLSPAAIEICRNASGAPGVRLSAEAVAAGGSEIRWYVSMGHCDAWAYAIAVALHAVQSSRHSPICEDTSNGRDCSSR